MRKKERSNREERQREVDRDGEKKYDKIVKQEHNRNINSLMIK